MQQRQVKRNKIPRLFTMTMSDVTVYQDPEQPLETHLEEQKLSDILHIFAQDS